MHVYTSNTLTIGLYRVIISTQVLRVITAFTPLPALRHCMLKHNCGVRPSSITILSITLLMLTTVLILVGLSMSVCRRSLPLSSTVLTTLLLLTALRARLLRVPCKVLIFVNMPQPRHHLLCYSISHNCPCVFEDCSILINVFKGSTVAFLARTSSLSAPSTPYSGGTMTRLSLVLFIFDIIPPTSPNGFSHLTTSL